MNPQISQMNPDAEQSDPQTFAIIVAWFRLPQPTRQ
jgi:hypothetical protein